MPGLSPDTIPLFYLPEYLTIQKYRCLHTEADVHFLGHFSILDSLATSLTLSPFGGIVRSEGTTLDQFLAFDQKLRHELANRGVSHLQIIQPPAIYQHLVPGAWLEEAGYQPVLADLQHVLPITDNLAKRMHPMELRKLKEGQDTFQIKVGGISVAEVHQFISNCRLAQGLEINVSLQKLEQLVHAFPDQYRFFTAWQQNILVAAVIMVAPVSTVAYYFLPATAPEFKSQSPMVMLLHYIYNHYRDLGFHFLDMGITSVNGKEQRSLATFKERMGAERMERIRYEAKTTLKTPL